MKQSMSINRGVTVLLAFVFIFWCLGESVQAQDSPTRRLPGPPLVTKNQTTITESEGETVWHVEVNSGCSYSDHFVQIDIDVEPDDISDARIKLTNFDVDYNDPQGCAGGPEVDYLYVNGNLIGQLQGANDSWSINEFDLLSSYLVMGTNEIYIDTDAPGAGCWCLGVGYVEITSKVGFQVIDYTPSDGQKNVHWDEPDITVEFSNELDTSTLSGNVKLEYRNQAGSWLEHATVSQSLSSKKIKLVAASDLKDGVRYRMTVTQGVKNDDGEELDQEYVWYFWTMVDLEGQTAELFKPNETKDKLQITWFQAIRNKTLVESRRTVNRIYVLWDPKDDVFDDDEVIEFSADVTLKVNNTDYVKPNYSIKRPDQYRPDQKKHAEHTIHFYHRASRDNSNKETYALTVEPKPQTGTPRKFEKNAEATVLARKSILKFNYWACEMAGWYGGVVAGELASSKSELVSGANFTYGVFPTIPLENDKGTVARGPGGFNMEYTETKADHTGKVVRWIRTPPGAGGTEKPEWQHVMLHLASLIPANHKFTAGLVPGDAIPGINGRRWNHVLLLLNGNFNAGTVAHEIGHEHGIASTTGAGCTAKHRNDPDGIEGFSVFTSKNKSYVEGNAESDKVAHQACSGTAYADPTPVIPLMNKWGVDTKLRWIRPENYEHLLNTLPAHVRKARALTGDYLMVLGSLDVDGNVEEVLPLYRVTQRHLEAPSGSGYTVELFSQDNGGGSSLGSYDFDTDDITSHSDNGTFETEESGMFAFTIPFDDSAESLVITGPNNTLIVNQGTFGSDAPEADFTSPVDGDTVSGTINVTWTGSDDSGTVYYRLEFSPDGSDWTPLTGQMDNMTSYSLDTTQLPTGSDQKLALIAYDGFNTTRKEIAITIDNNVTLRATTPPDGQTDVSQGQVLRAYFVSDMQTGTINTDTFTLSGGSTYQVAGEVLYDEETRVASFSPDASLEPETRYTARLTGGIEGVRDADNNTLSYSHSWSFTTAAVQSNPQVVSVSPERGTANVPVNTMIQAVFQYEVLASTIDNSTFSVADSDGNPVSGAISYIAETKSALFVPVTPTLNLDAYTDYTVTLSTAITDPQGLALESDYSWSFTTGSKRSDGIRITHISYDRAEDDDGDGLNDRLVVRAMVEAMKSGSYNVNGQLLDKNDESIAWTSTTDFFSEPGVYAMDLKFKGTDIGSHGIDGPYEVANLYVYDASDPTTFHSFQKYTTYSYKADDFYTVIRLVNVPDIAVGIGSLNENVINLESYVSHISADASSLTYSILINSNPDVGIGIDEEHNLDINPVVADETDPAAAADNSTGTTGLGGFSDVTVEVKDSDGFRSLDTFRVSVLPAYSFADKGNYYVSLVNQPGDNATAAVLASIDGQYKNVWTLDNRRWRLLDTAVDGLDTMTPGQGYLISISEPGSLRIIGTMIKGRPVNLVKGWNLVGYNSTDSIPIDEALSSIAGNYEKVHAKIGGKWLAYDPKRPNFSSLKIMEPGYSYLIKVTKESTWTLPDL